jgi:hypothetical protein
MLQKPEWIRDVINPAKTCPPRFRSFGRAFFYHSNILPAVNLNSLYTPKEKEFKPDYI